MAIDTERGNQPHVGFVPSRHIEHVEDLLHAIYLMYNIVMVG